MKVIILTLYVFFAFLTSAKAGEVYTYTDEKGVITVSNTPIPDKYKKKVKKIDSYEDTITEKIAKITNEYGLDPSGFNDIYEYFDALSPDKYKKYVDNNKDKAQRLGIGYTIDGTGKITKVISRDKVERYRQEVKQKKREDEMIKQHELDRQARILESILSSGSGERSYTLCPNGKYVAGSRCIMTPDGNYVGH